MGRFRIAAGPFDTGPLRERLFRDEAGACNIFEGWVRNHNEGRPVRGLRYESYVGLAESEGEKILAEAVERFALAQAVCVHRTGELAIGDLAVWVGVSAGHRDMVFAACRWIIDEVKARVPIWKHEHYLDGDGAWLHPDEGAPAAEQKGGGPAD